MKPLKLIFSFILFLLFSQAGIAQRPSKEQMEADKKKLAEAMKKLDEQTSKMDPKAKQGYDSLLNVYGMGQKKDEAIKQVNNEKQGATKKSVGLAKSQPTEMPEKQTGLLNGLPKITTAAQYESYLTDIKRKAGQKIDPSFKSNVDILVDKNKGNTTQLNNLPPMLLIQQQVEAAMYAAISVAIVNKDNLVSQLNLTSILHQTGYPQYAVPLLEYLSTKNKADVFASNLGQSYLSLGDKDKAKTCFMRALAANPNNVSANCGMGFIEANGSNPQAAAPYIEKVMKDSYSATLEKLASQKNIKLNYKSMRPKVPDTFSPEKYKVRPSALKFEEVEEAIEKRLQVHRVEEDWVRKLQKANTDFSAQTAKMNTNQLLELYGGYVNNSFLAKKARFMTTQADLYFNDFAMRIAPAYNNLRLQIAKMQEDLKQATNKIRTDISDSYAACQEMKKSLNTYLQKTAGLTDDFVRLNIYDFYDYTSQQLYWNKFLVTQPMYNQKFYQYAQSLLKTVDDYGNIQALDVAHTIVYDCEKQTAAKKPNIDGNENPANCPFSFKVGLGVGSVKSNCHGWTIEGGELVIGSLSKNYQTGEYSIGFGMGGNLQAPFLGGSIGAQMVVTVGSDFIPTDLGLVGNAGIEATTGPVVIGEEGVNAVMSIASGLNIDAVHAGQSYNLLSVSPKN